MAEKKYYWIKLKTDFFEEPTIDWLLSQKNGCEYIVLYQMICLQAANNNGDLSTKIGEMIIPYNVEKIVRDTKYFDFDTVTIALNLYKQIGLIYEEDNNVLRISKFDEMVGNSTMDDHTRKLNAERQRRFREKKKQISNDNGVTVTLLSNTEIDIEKEIEIDKELDKEINKESCTNVQQKKPKKPKPVKHKRGEYEHVLLTDDEYNKLCVEYGHDKTNEAIKFLDEYIEEKGYTSKSHYLAIKRWVFNAVEKKNNNGKQAKQKEELVF